MRNDGHSPRDPGAGKKGDPYVIVIGERLDWDGIGRITRQQSLPQAKATFVALRAAPRVLVSAGEADDLEPQPTSLPSPSAANAVRAALPPRTPPGMWRKLAALTTFLLDPFLLGHGSRDLSLEARGELLWISQEERTHTDAPPVHPVVVVHTTSDPRRIPHVEIAPHFQPDDPLLQHLILVLRVEQTAESAAKRCSAEALTNALAVHFLKRYAVTGEPESSVSGGLPPHKLRRATAYIDAHLEQPLPLAEIAAVTGTSITHFARLFRHDTSMTPHQFVISRRIKRAKELLATTELSLSEIGNRVGFTDQSHFSAVFRKHVGVTPRLHRRNASRAIEEI